MIRNPTRNIENVEKGKNGAFKCWYLDWWNSFSLEDRLQIVMPTCKQKYTNPTSWESVEIKVELTRKPKLSVLY